MNGRTTGLWALLAAGLVLTSCEEGAPVATLTTDLEAYLNADGVTIGGEHVFLNAEGVRASRIEFDTMYQWRDSTHHTLRGIDLRVLNEDGSQRTHVTALRGRMDPRGEGLLAQGDVVLVMAAEDRRLETGELHYDPDNDRIWSDSSFVMTFQGRVIRGSAFTSDTEFRSFQATGPGG